MITAEDLIDILQQVPPDHKVKVDMPDGFVDLSPAWSITVGDSAIILKPINAWRWDRRRAFRGDATSSG